jgi:glycosyltransferase involved in cell wall biosynthesis
MRPLRIALDAQLAFDGSAGGVEQFVTSLIWALGRLEEGHEEYVIVCHEDAVPRLRRLLGPRQTLHATYARPAVLALARRLGRPAWRRIRQATAGSRTRASAPNVPSSEGLYEGLGADVVHFPFQRYARCRVPTIFNPHDLQHRHYPEFFPSDLLAWREVMYSAGCRESAAIAVESRSVKDDVVAQYAVEPRKVHVIMRGAPTEAYGEIPRELPAQIRSRFNLPERFALYPAQTWPHKNHLRLLEAVAVLRDEDDLQLHVVCTGRQNEHWSVIRAAMRRLALQSAVHFLGFVDPLELRALYRMAEFVVFPTLFEGGGFPIVEAFLEHTPVTCANVTSLPEYAGDAALFFDPTSVDSIADAMRRMATDEALRDVLRRRGADRVRVLTWSRTSRAYRALYRKVAGRELTEEDRELLAQ